MIACLVNGLGNMLQNEVMLIFKIQRCYSQGVTENKHKRSGQSSYTEEAKL